jgi:excinuclease ABC subunit C
VDKILEKKLADLPKEPGVYFHKDAGGEIIYVGKAAVLRNRVRQYFQKSRARDPKTEALVAEIADTDWMVVDSEIEALFLEAEMVRRYMPRYNILLRDDKAMAYIRISYDSDFPTVSTTRRPLDDGAKYFGPYLSVLSVRQALKSLRKIFPYATRQIGGQKRATLFYHLRLDPGLEEGKTSLEDYRANLRKLMSVIEGKRKTVEKDLEKEMKQAANAAEFETAAKIRNQLYALQNLTRQVIFSDKEFLDISKDHALQELVDLLSLPNFPQRIEGYDISHMQGTNVVASMVVFANGASNKRDYRKFKMTKQHNNDFYNMHETITRRLSAKNLKAWGTPSLMLIDGGKGQLDAALRARTEAASAIGSYPLAEIPFIGLAKREEQIVIKKGRGQSAEGIAELRPKGSVIPACEPESSQKAIADNDTNDTCRFRVKPGMTSECKDAGTASNVQLNPEILQKLGGFTTESEEFILVNLPHSTNLVKLLQRIRDESHRFAVSYHSTLKNKQQTASTLDEIPGIGPATRKKLLKTFGSMQKISQASQADLSRSIGPAKARQLAAYLKILAT